MITIKDINHSFRKIECDDINEFKEIYDYFSLKIPGIEFSPAYKMGITDGKKKFIYKDGKFLYGLKNKIIQYCESNMIEYKDLTKPISQEFNQEEFDTFLKELDLPFEPYEHQIKGAVEVIKNKRIIIQSFTGCLDPKEKIKIYIEDKIE